MPRPGVEEELSPGPEEKVTEAEILEAPIDPYFEMPTLPNDPEVEATREGIHKRIQAETYH